MKASTTDIHLLNNTGNKSREVLIDTFVVRETEFHTVMSSITEGSGRHRFKNILIIGLRGAGKTTLLHRVRYAIEDEALLNKAYATVMFSEEQYHLTDLPTLWESVAQVLQENHGWDGVSDEIQSIVERAGLDEAGLYSVLERAAISRGVSLILFFENINVFWGKLTQKEREIFKQRITEQQVVRVIASSTSYTDSRVDLSTPFFNFFSVVELRSLNKAECEKLLLKIGVLQGQEEQISHIIKNHPGRIESLRRLTGGVPRTISYLFQIFLDNSNGKAIKDLYILIDTLTFLYKAELDQLSSQQQRLIDTIARNWDALPTKEIAQRTRLESKNVSTILALLERNQLVEVVKTGGKNNLYRIKDRFLNIWYLMRFGRRHDKNNVIWLVRFFDTWCDETELAKRVRDHINELSKGGYDEEAAVDMGNTFLSCENLPHSMKLQLLEASKSVLGERMYKKLQPSAALMGEAFNEYVRKGEYDQALQSVEQMNLEEVDQNGLFTYLYFAKQDFVRSAEYAKRVLAVHPDDATAALTLGLILEEYLKNIGEARKYYHVALEASPDHPYAASRLGDLAYRVDDDVEQAKHYHGLAIRKGIKGSYLALGKILYEEGDLDEAELYFREAERSKLQGAYLALGKLYADKHKNRKALRYFQKSVDNKEDMALINMGNWYRYHTSPQFDKAIHFYEKSIKAGEVEAYSELGELLIEIDREDEAVKLLMTGVIHNDPNSAHTLGHFYLDQGKFKEAETFFLKSHDLGRKGALLCLAEGFYIAGYEAGRRDVLKILKQYEKEYDGFIFFDLIQAKMLAWNDETVQALELLENWMSFHMAKIINHADEQNETLLRPVIKELSALLILLIAKGHTGHAYRLFNTESKFHLTTVLRPVYFALMSLMKAEFPNEYLKAGDELKETVKEVLEQIIKLKNRFKLKS